MTRVAPASVATIGLVVAMLLGACQSAPPSTLTDPREILAAAVRSTTAAKSVRIDGSADGTVALDLLGAGTPAPIELTGTTASADLDLQAGNARATFSAPGLLGLTGELIAVDGTTYIKTTLTGALYQVVFPSVNVSQPSGEGRATILRNVTNLLSNPALEPVKGEDVACGATTCYRVDIALSPEDLAALGAGEIETPAGLPIPIELPDLSAATVDLQVLVTKDTTRLAGLTAVADLGDAGTATVQLTFSKWDEAVSISVPPPDQVMPN